MLAAKGQSPKNRIFSAFLAGTRIFASYFFMWTLLPTPSCLYFTGPKYRSSQLSVSLII